MATFAMFDILSCAEILLPRIRDSRDLDQKNMYEKLPFEEVEHNPEALLPADHVNLLADLLRYCAEVMTSIYSNDHWRNEDPPETEIAHSYTSAFESAVWLLEAQGLVICLGNDAYRLEVPCDQFQSVSLKRYQAKKLKYDDFNRALEAPLHLSRQSEVRASKATIAQINGGLRELGLVEGPQGASVWAYKSLDYVWFSAHGTAVEAASYSGSNDFERFYVEAL